MKPLAESDLIQKRLKINTQLRLLKADSATNQDSEDPHFQSEGYKLSCLIELCRTINSTKDADTILEKSMRIVSDFLFSKRTMILLISNELDNSHKLYSLRGKDGKIRKMQISDRRFHQFYAAIGSRPNAVNIRLKNLSANFTSNKELYLHPIIAQNTLLGYLLAERKHNLEIGRVDSNIMQTWTEHLAISILNIRMHEMANRDFLTDLYLRRYFMEKVDAIIEKSKTSSFIILDLDHFKNINDKFGHQTGDSVLKETAQVLKDCIRKEDLCSRFGGEEFGILLPDTTAKVAESIAKRIKKGLSKIKINNCKKITASFGIAHGNEQIDFYALYNKADKALYEAKRSGRNKILLVN